MAVDLLRSICADCTEEQRKICRNADKGCDEFYKWRSNHVDMILKAADELEKLKCQENLIH